MSAPREEAGGFERGENGSNKYDSRGSGVRISLLDAYAAAVQVVSHG